MYLFLLTTKESPDWDSYDAHLVRAKDPQHARKLAQGTHGDEGPIWENPKLTSCRRIKEEGTPKIIISSFNAG